MLARMYFHSDMREAKIVPVTKFVFGTATGSAPCAALQASAAMDRGPNRLVTLQRLMSFILYTAPGF